MKRIEIMQLKIFYFMVFLIEKITNNPKVKKLRTILNELDNLGHINIANYFSNSELNFYKKEVYNIIKNNTEYDDGDEETKPGNLKAKHLQNYSSALKKLTEHSFFLILSFIFYGRPRLATVIFTYSQDGTYKDNIISGKCTSQVADEPHFDSYKNYLKIIILLDDVNDLNGPTYMLESSSKNPLLKKHYRNFKNDKMIPTIIKTDRLLKLKEKHKTVSLTGSKGDIILLNTKNIHWAGSFETGKRELLWLYF